MLEPDRGTRTASVWPFVAFTGIVFGGGGLLAKGLVDDGVDAFTVTWFPFLAAGVLGLVTGAIRRELRLGALVAAVLLGVTASAAPALLFNIGFERLPAGIVTLIISLGPVFTAVVAHFVFPDERFNRPKAAGLVLAVTGVGILAAGSAAGDGSAGAIALVLAGSACAGAGAVLARQLALRHGAPALIGPQLAVAGLVVLVLSPLLGRDLAPDGGFAAWHLVGLITFGVTTYLGFFSLLKANEVGTTGQVSIIGYCIPLFGVVGGLLLFDDPFSAALVVGGGLIVVSIALIATGSSR